jgi:hypothetical protein
VPSRVAPLRPLCSLVRLKLRGALLDEASDLNAVPPVTHFLTAVRPLLEAHSEVASKRVHRRRSNEPDQSVSVDPRIDLSGGVGGLRPKMPEDGLKFDIDADSQRILVPVSPPHLPENVLDCFIES